MEKVVSTEKLWERYLKRRARKVRDELIERYMHLVKHVAGRMGVSLPPHLSVDDLLSTGSMGLQRAVERFDPERGAKFESYAILLIKGAVIDELRAQDWVPRSVYQKAAEVAKAQKALTAKLGREPDDEEVAKKLKIMPEAYLQLLERIRPAMMLSLNAPLGDDQEALTLAEQIADERATSGPDELARKEKEKVMRAAIEALPDQERKVLTLYYYDELVLREIGKVLGVGESRVSQIHAKALLRLKGELSGYHFGR